MVAAALQDHLSRSLCLKKPRPTQFLSSSQLHQQLSLKASLEKRKRNLDVHYVLSMTYIMPLVKLYQYHLLLNLLIPFLADGWVHWLDVTIIPFICFLHMSRLHSIAVCYETKEVDEMGTE